MSCSICNTPKAQLSCGLCQATLCKGCTEFVEEERFSFMRTKPPELSCETYCHICFTEKVIPLMNAYDSTIEKAKGVLVFDRTQGKETRLASRKEKPIRVQDCKDHDETIMRMAFAAVEAGYNAIIDLVITTRKIKDGSYTTLLFSGEAVPTHVDEARLPKDRSLWHQPN